MAKAVEVGDRMLVFNAQRMRWELADITTIRVGGESADVTFAFDGRSSALHIVACMRYPTSAETPHAQF